LNQLVELLQVGAIVIESSEDFICEPGTVQRLVLKSDQAYFMQSHDFIGWQEPGTMEPGTMEPGTMEPGTMMSGAR
jgi:hypothetical protein